MLNDYQFDKFKYILYKPPDVSNPPLIVILHGSGEIGSSLSKLKQREPYISLNNGKCKPSACVLMPQLPKGTWGDYKSSLKKLIDHVAAENCCDTGNIAISGHSLGANGAMDMLFAYPYFFRAASILSPCKDYGEKLIQLLHIPIWFLHGEKENSFRTYAISMHNRLEKLYGTTKITSVTGYGHPIQFMWTSEKYGMFDWLTSFKAGRLIVDVSKYQGSIDWDVLAPHLAFCAIKASGLYANGSDPYYARNVAGATAHGVPFHVFHFLYCVTEAQAKRDAKLFFETVKGQGHWPLFWVLDCEGAWGVANSQAPTIAGIFENELRRLAREQGPGEIRVAIYAAQEKYKSWAFDYDHFAYVWIPGYGEKFKPTMPCDIWQYTSTGPAPGISGNVDIDVLTGTKPLEYFTTTPDIPGTPNIPDEKTDGGESQMFTGKHLAEYCEEFYRHKDHWAYWYGTYGNKCTQSKYESKKKQYPDHYGSSRTSGYMKDIEQGRRCADCVGMIKSFFWTGNQYDADPKYGTNNCPDKSANGMYNLCKKTGKIGTIPDIPGLIVWKSGHIGVYVGGGFTVEMKGFDYDCQRNKVTKGPWTNWGMLPDTMISYDDAPVPEPVKLGDRDLKKGCEGADVVELQNDLMKLGYALPQYGADGDFGSETQKAVKAFQLTYGLADDGVMNVGNDYNVLFKALDGDKPQEYKSVEITGGSVNVRSAPGYNSKIYGTAHKGDILPYQGVEQEAEGKPWYLVVFKNQNAWVSSKYAKLVK